MDPGYRSPLVDLFLKGSATRDVRLLAARGLLPRPAQEQIALLVVLVDDPDPDIAAIADATISRLPQAAVQELLSADSPAELRAFFADRAARSAVAAPAPSTPGDAQEPSEAADGQANDKTGEGDEAERGGR